ncbi:PhoH family protein [Salibacterium salarium]|uniref:PhoH family protein n=1 Tax=Salibacterium salarium TaxID=284579 RepID=A0A3R9P4Z4_9BACI|nr:PhoH family protein [Salibacterium salarium]RSL30412.1 PhoH family protein [Salibacterium salarium]
MRKIYVIDTNVLLQEPRALFQFEDNEVVIPAVVLEEIDAKKRYMDELGRNAREVSRILDSLRNKGKLHEGVPLYEGGTIRVELNHRSFQYLKDTFAEMTNDNRILAVAMNLQMEQENAGSPKKVIIVSKDALVRVKADALGIKAENFLSDRVTEYDNIYKGKIEYNVPLETLNEFYENQQLPADAVDADKWNPNQFVILKDALGSSASAVGKVDATGKWIKPFVAEAEHVWGIRPRNVEQKMALELLLHDSIPLVTLTGKAGTGKTLLSLAAGLLQTEDLGKYNKLLVARPVVPMGKDIGFLPGEKEEKLRPWMQPVFDNLEYLFNTKKPGELDQILAGMGSIQVEALTYIRGRSIPDQFIIIDEAQNLTKHEVKTILTRVGEGSKIVFMGDPAQIDHPYLDELNNGLAYIVEKFKGKGVSGHIKLEKGERSGLAQLAADIL